MNGIVVPAIILAVAGWFMPRLWARVLPEGLRPLMYNALLSTVSMGLLGVVYFIGLYLMMGYPVAELFAAGVVPVVSHFGPLALMSALIWGPIVILSVASLPRRWKKAVW